MLATPGVNPATCRVHRARGSRGAPNVVLRTPRAATRTLELDVERCVQHTTPPTINRRAAVDAMTQDISLRAARTDQIARDMKAQWGAYCAAPPRRRYAARSGRSPSV